MARRSALAFLLFFTNLVPTWAATQSGPVIFITLDGVRWQEVFRGVDPAHASETSADPLFPALTAFPGSYLAGNRDDARSARANASNLTLKSLPAYQSITKGKVTTCLHNECARLRGETFLSRITDELEPGFFGNAVFSSWDRIERAVGGIPGAFYVNAGNQPVEDGFVDDESDRLNEEQARDVAHWERWDARWDRLTWAQAIRYLKLHRPLFLWISLNDSDEWAHLDHYADHAATLRQYDRWIAELFALLGTMGDYGARASVIVTTDHGRGRGKNWTEHGLTKPGSRQIWLFASTPGTRAANPSTGDAASRTNAQESPSRAAARAGSISHLDLRPTIESLLGMKPHSCWRCGSPIAQLDP